MKKNTVLDTLKRFEKIKTTNFSFAFFAYLIFEKSDKTLDAIKSYFPNEILNLINDDIDFILRNKDNKTNDQSFWNNFNTAKYNIIIQLYSLFISKKKEIEKNSNTINLSKITSDKINIKVKELQTKFYSYDSSKIKKKTMTDSIDKLSQNIEQVIQEITESQEIDNKEKKKKENEILILADKFLIIDKNRESVDKKMSQKKAINISEIINQSTSVDAIEIEEIIHPKTYSINSLMEFFGSCILKTQMLPPFIRYAVKINDENQKTKAINILNDLYNLYKCLDKNHSLLSPRTEEYQNSFEIMFSKLKNSGVSFSKDLELQKLKFDDNNQIQDFIILPEKDNFTISKSDF